MEALLLELRAGLAVIAKELRHLSRYRLDLSALFFTPVIQFLLPSLLLGATFLVAGRPAGFARTTGTDDVAGFFVLGAIVSGLTFVAFWGAGFAFRRDMMSGTLEPLWLVPTRRHTIVAGYAGAYTVISLASAGVLLLFGALFLHTFPWRAALLLVPVTAVLEVAMLGVTFLVVSATLLVRDPNLVVDVGSYLFQALSGVMFPVTVMPALLGAVAFALPTTYALDALRAVSLGTRSLLPVPVELALVVALACGLVPLGAWAFALTDRRLRRLGMLGSY